MARRIQVRPGATKPPMAEAVHVGGQYTKFSARFQNAKTFAQQGLRVVNVFVLDVPALGALHRTTARSTTMLSRALRLQSVEATFDGDLGQFAAHGRVLGDTVLSVAITSEGDSQMTRIPLQGPVTLPTLLPLRLAFGGELRSGRSYTARLFDPLLLTSRDVTARVAAESTLVVPDSADQAVTLAHDAVESATKHFIGLTVAIDVGRHEGANALFMGALNDGDETILGQSLAKMHVASATPGAVSCAGQVH